MPKRIVTIAGSDTLSGGGIQADLATYSEYGLFAFSVLTSIVTYVGDDFVLRPIDKTILQEELDTVFQLPEIFGVKLGLLPSVEIIQMVAATLQRFQHLPIVLDPVLVFKENNEEDLSGIKEAMIEHLFPLATIITPNIEEAKILTGMNEIRTIEEMETACRLLHQLGAKNIVIKGGMRIEGTDACDVFFDGEKMHLFHAKKVDTSNNNGAGCTFASAIASNLLHGLSLEEAIQDAKDFVHWGIKYGIPLSNQLGNVWQGARRSKSEESE